MNLRVIVGWTAAFALGSVIAAESGTTKSTVRINLDDLPAEQPKTTKPVPGKTAGPTTGATNSTTKTTAPNVKDAKAKKPGEAAKKEPKREIDGFAVSRGERGFLGIKVKDNTFQVAFYDKDKKPIPADVSSIALRWPVPYQPNPERTVLTPTGDGKVMASEKTVRPPYHYRLFVTLLKDTGAGQSEAVENYTVEFEQ